jgi:hypothetical protein
VLHLHCLLVLSTIKRTSVYATVTGNLTMLFVQLLSCGVKRGTLNDKLRGGRKSAWSVFKYSWKAKIWTQDVPNRKQECHQPHNAKFSLSALNPPCLSNETTNMRRSTSLADHIWMRMETSFQTFRSLEGSGGGGEFNKQNGLIIVRNCGVTVCVCPSP